MRTQEMLIAVGGSADGRRIQVPLQANRVDVHCKEPFNPQPGPNHYPIAALKRETYEVECIHFERGQAVYFARLAEMSSMNAFVQLLTAYEGRKNV